MIVFFKNIISQKKDYENIPDLRKIQTYQLNGMPGPSTRGKCYKGHYK